MITVPERYSADGRTDRQTSDDTPWHDHALRSNRTVKFTLVSVSNIHTLLHQSSTQNNSLPIDGTEISIPYCADFKMFDIVPSPFSTIYGILRTQLIYVYANDPM